MTATNCRGFKGKGGGAGGGREGAGGAIND